MNIISQIQHRRDTTANWVLHNPILAEGELGIEFYDNNIIKIKIGNGINTWNELTYLSNPETVISNSNASGVVDLDVSIANIFEIILSGTTTFTFSNPAVSGKNTSLTIFIQQGVVAQTITWPASVVWLGDIAPDLSTINQTYIVQFNTINGGIRWYGTLTGKVTT